MHIPDGFLTNRLAVSLDLISGASIFYVARFAKIDIHSRIVPMMGVLAAFVFAVQILNFPILGGTSGHLVGGALLGILLGPMAGFLTMATVVIGQAAFLQDGGLLALGANIFNIGAVTSFSGYFTYRVVGGRVVEGKRPFLAGFLAGWVSLLLSSACCAFELALSAVISLRLGLPAMVGYHAIIGLFEGLLTAGVLSFLYNVRPDLLRLNVRTSLGFSDWVGAIVLVAIPGLVLVLGGSSGLPDPLQKLLFVDTLQPGSVASAGLSSTLRYTEYIVRAGFSVLLVGIAYLAFRFSLARKNR